MTVYVCSCGSTHEFMSLAVICAETHLIGVAPDGNRALATPVLAERRTG